MYNRPRGTEDVYGDYSDLFQIIESRIAQVGKQFGFREIRTPIFEATELFVRSVGETSDIVKKEFYNFKDKGDRDIVLRPEGTAGVIRAVVEEKLLNKFPLPLRLMYHGPMFRYERPQSGRLRQFNQFGFEIIGTNTIADDIEILLLSVAILDAIEIKNWTLKINNIGNFTTRNRWVSALKTYFAQYRDQLNPLNQQRLDSNPLRILDDKEDGKKAFVKNAPQIAQFLTPEEIRDQTQLETQLKALKIKYIVDPTLVRGLDYYTNLVFEFNADDSAAILAGGRYSKLLGEIGGPDYGCIGFALGIERMIKLLIAQKTKLIAEQKNTIVVLAPLSEKCIEQALAIANLIRQKTTAVVLCNYSTYKLPKHFSYAEKHHADYVIIIGEKEIKDGTVIIKEQKKLSQKVVKIKELLSAIK